MPGQLWFMFKGSKDVKATLKNKSRGPQQTSVSSEKWESWTKCEVSKPEIFNRIIYTWMGKF